MTPAAAAGVSVVIPVHRGGPYVREAVASVLGQSRRDLEVVVVSDGCPEDLGDLEVMDPRVRVVRRDHAGVSVARNVGVAESAAEFVAFLDEDDLARPCRLERQLEALAGGPGRGMCHGGFEVIDAEGTVVTGPRGAPLQYEDMLALNFPLLSTVTVRRSLFHEVGGFDPALVRGEDIEFFLRAAMRTEVAFVDEVRRRLPAPRLEHHHRGLGHLPVIRRHRRWAELTSRPDLAAAADVGLRRNRRNAARAAFDDARSARRRGAVGEMVRCLALSLDARPGLRPRGGLGPGHRSTRPIARGPHARPVASGAAPPGGATSPGGTGGGGTTVTATQEHTGAAPEGRQHPVAPRRGGVGGGGDLRAARPRAPLPRTPPRPDRGHPTRSSWSTPPRATRPAGWCQAHFPSVTYAECPAGRGATATARTSPTGGRTATCWPSSTTTPSPSPTGSSACCRSTTTQASVGWVADRSASSPGSWRRGWTPSGASGPTAR